MPRAATRKPGNPYPAGMASALRGVEENAMDNTQPAITASAWYKSSNYDHCEQWGAVEWAYAIMLRLDARRRHEHPMYVKGLFDIRPSFTTAYATYKDIFPLSIGWLGGLHESVIDHVANEAKQFLDNASEGMTTRDGSELDRLIRDLDFPGTGGSDALTVINLDAPDDLLAKQFMEFVHERRKALEIEALTEVPGEADFQRWHKHKVLGYFDLCWHTGDLTNEEIGRILFPDEYSISLADKVRKVVKPLANTVFRPATLSALLHVAERLDSAQDT